MDRTAVIEADDAVTTGEQYEDCAGSLASKKKHPLSSNGDWYVPDDRRAGRGSLSKNKGNR